MSNTDDVLNSVLLHSTRTLAYLKRLKKNEPEKWQRVFGNIATAYHILKPKEITVSTYLIGVYDPGQNERWPWHCHYDDGQYLSNKYRLCGFERAAVFTSADSARLFFHNWKNKGNLKMELIERQRIEKVDE